MSILEGTTSTGQIIPVLVDGQGRLVAQGLNGPQGPAGPTGPQGPKGDPGQSINSFGFKPATGRTVEFLNIPSWATKLTFVVNGVKLNDSAICFILLGAGGSFQGTQYATISTSTSTDPVTYPAVAQHFTNGFAALGININANRVGAITFHKVKPDRWIGTGNFYDLVGYGGISTGFAQLLGPLDCVVAYAATPTGEFSEGSFGLFYE